MNQAHPSNIVVLASGVSKDDAPSPLALIFANKIRQALNHKSYVEQAKGCEGCFGLQSKTDPQAITITIKKTEITVSAGLSQHCQIIILLDLNDPGAIPSVKSLWRHPLYTMQVGKLLTFPEVLWADALKRFWEQSKDYSGMPEGMSVKCTDEDRRLSVGNMETACYFEGRSTDLAEAFSGGTPFVQLLATGKLTGHYTFEQATVLSDLTLQMMLGER